MDTLIDNELLFLHPLNMSITAKIVRYTTSKKVRLGYNISYYHILIIEH